jgi:hypothetical protein
VVAVLAMAGPFIYIHLIEGPAPAKLTLPATTTSTGAGSSTPAGRSPTGANTVDRTWHVGTGSVVGYRVQEVLIGQTARQWAGPPTSPATSPSSTPR